MGGARRPAASNELEATMKVNPASSPNAAPGGDAPCGDIYLDGQHLGFFWSPCAEVEKLLRVLTGRKVHLPRQAPGDFAWIRSSDVLSVQLLGPGRARRKATGWENRGCSGSLSFQKSMVDF